MAEESHVLQGINWRQTFPFTQVFRSFRIAIHPSKLVLALAMLILLYLGGLLLDGVWSTSHKPIYTDFIDRYELLRSRAGSDTVPPSFVKNAADPDWALGFDGNPLAIQTYDKHFGIFQTFLEYEVRKFNGVIAGVFGWNWGGPSGIIFSSVNFIVTGPLYLFKFHWLFAIIFFLWFLSVWSIFGGAIARIAAVHAARDEKISVRQALKFSLSKVLSFFFAPVIPILIVLAIGIVVAIGALINNIPAIGAIVVGATFFLALAAGFVMTLVFLGTMGGFNLMYPTIAVEGSDSFDAISRSFSYLYARPWRLGLYTALAVVYGALTYVFIRLFIFLMLFFASWFVGAGTYIKSSDQSTNLWKAMWPPLSVDTLAPGPIWSSLNWGSRIGAGLVEFWVYLVLALLGAYVISFFFSANTIIYYLMRQEVDATELDDVYMEQSDEDFAEAVPAVVEAPTSSVVATPANAGGVEVPLPGIPDTEAAPVVPPAPPADASSATENI